MSMITAAPRAKNFPPQSSASSSGQQYQQQYSQPSSSRGGNSQRPAAASGVDDGTAGVGSMQMSPQQTEEERQLHATLGKMAHYVRKTRLQIHPFFADFDKHKQGAISTTQFARVLAIAGFAGMTQEVMENLARHYALPSDSTKVSHRAFIADLMAIAQAQQAAQYDSMQRATAGQTLDWQEAQARNPLVKREEEKQGPGSYGNGMKQPFTTLHDIHAESPLTAQKILHKIQTLCQQKRIILTDIFADFDQLRKNLITLQRFRRCLDIAGFQLSDAEANILVGQYANERDVNMVEYKRFIADVLAPFIPSNPETSPLGTLADFAPYRLEEHETPAPRFTQEESDRIEFLLKELGYQTHTRRILIKPGFAHHDHTRSGCVTARQFASVLTATFPFRFTPRDLDLLSAKYRRGDVGIHYLTFLKDIAEQEIGASEYAKTLHPSHAASALQSMQFGQNPPMQLLPSRNGPQVIAGMKIIPSRSALQEQEASAYSRGSLQEVLGRIRATLQRNRQDISDIFRDFDGLNKGKVTRPQFFRCLTISGLKLSPADIQLLTEHYPHAEVQADVDYRRFVGDLSTIPTF
jgi:Ca2+-binding EF-hand superfamily protein